MQTGLCTSRSWLYILHVSCAPARRVQPKHGLASVPEHKEGRPVTNCVKRSARNDVDNPFLASIVASDICDAWESTFPHWIWQPDHKHDGWSECQCVHALAESSWSALMPWIVWEPFCFPWSWADQELIPHGQQCMRESLVESAMVVLPCHVSWKSNHPLWYGAAWL